MAIYIDSAVFNEVEAARALAWVRGVTTNPLLLAKANRDPGTVLRELANLNFGSLFYQLVSPTLDGMRKEMELAAHVVGPSLVLKVPPTQSGFQFVSQCTEHPCCVTTVYTPAQALIAGETNARYVAVYVNRATRLMGDGLNLVRQVAEILKHSKTEVIAASVKSAEEACASLSAGAHHLTLPYEVLMSLMHDPLSDQTVEEFQENGIGIYR
ncbi:MAG TPA: transaldolase family protein [Anaerolineales bacterium]|nr:transaldolase family protein [Anaerolineales bacterium]